MEALQITYCFSADSATSTRFVVSLDPVALSLQRPPRAEVPEWIKLEHHQCPDCPLANTTATNCPMAEALIDLQNFASHLDSFKPLDVTVTTLEREIRAVVPAQRALSSLMGLLIATCACPDVAWLRPMARFHLPMASEAETIYRATSMYLLAQYFRNAAGAAPDFSLAGLGGRYQRLHQINVAMAARLRSFVGKDAPVNAVVLLDLFAKTMPYSVAESVAELEYLFRPYLEQAQPTERTN